MLKPTIKIKSPSGDSSFSVYYLQPGQLFPGFGGTSGLLVKGSPSVITREDSPGMTNDIEFPAADLRPWAGVMRRMDRGWTIA